jgi:hypothetical protein
MRVKLVAVERSAATEPGPSLEIEPEAADPGSWADMAVFKPAER